MAKAPPPPQQVKRTTKTAGKLVLLPASEEDGKGFSVSSPELPDKSLGKRTQHLSIPEQTSKLARRDLPYLPRLTAYAISDAGINLDTVKYHLKQSHGVNAESYDECLLATYENATKHAIVPPTAAEIPSLISERSTLASIDPSLSTDTAATLADVKSISAPSLSSGQADNTVQQQHPAWMDSSDIFIFDYGVVVFWNFTKGQEERFIPIFQHCGATTLLPLEQMEMEDLNYQYDYESTQPPLLRLSISHGLAQSVTLSQYERKIEDSIANCISIPHEMARLGFIRMDRPDVLKRIGELFELRMNVNLVSNVLDTPELFWSEPQLQELYSTVRGYFEIGQRAGLLNKRCEVLTDLMSMMNDHQHSSQMSYITWIIIVLVAGCVVVAVVEVWVKVLRLQSERDHRYL
ncbi:MAG: hypothetical protein SGCHY_002960 [Lobulomycetales sp.]